MPKLTINSVCDRGSVYPIICNFQNGYPSEDFECKCAIIQDNNGKKTIAAEFGRILYVGAEDNETIGQTLLLLRNRKTGKVRLIETNSVELKPIIDLNHDQEKTQHQQQGNRVVKPVQYEETGTHTGIIECDVISNSSTPVSLSNSGHRRNSTPSKKGSTTSFSRTHSGQFQHLHNFVVDEIRTIPNHQSETECNKSPKSIKVIETNKIEEFTIDIGAKQRKEANKMTGSKELPINMSEKKETGMGNGGIASENSNFTVDVSTEELEEENKMIANEEPLEEFLDEKGTDLEAKEMDSTIDIKELSIFLSDSADTSSEFEDENNLKSKMDQEKHEENCEIHKNFSIKQYYAAALGLDSKGGKKEKQNADSSTSNDNLTNARTTNDSINSNHAANIYICDYCQAVFENKGLMIFHLISHEFVMDTNNESNIQTDIGNDRNCDHNENFNGFNDSKRSKRNKVDTTTNNWSVNNNQIVMENTSSNHTYICDYCEAVFKNKGTLISHVISHEFVNNTSNNMTHGQNKIIIRNDNEHEITNFNEKSNELKDSKNKKRKNIIFTENTAFDNTYICDYCEVMFENKGALILHLMTHESVNDTSNDVTHSLNKRIRNDNEHEITDLNKKSKKLKNGKNEKRPKTTITENTAFDNTYICDYCEALFENKGALIFHLNSYALVKQICKGTQSRIKRTITTANNDNESNSDSKKTSNECKDGDNKTTKKYTGDTVTKNVFAHNKTVTENISSGNTYICGYCEAMFEDKGTLISHITSHEKHIYNNTPEQESARIINIDNYENKNAGSIIKDTDNENVTLSKIKTTIAIDGDNNENENAYSKNYRNKIDENRNPEFNATENIYICDYCEAVLEDKESLVLHLISHKFIKDIDNTKIKEIKVTENKNNENVNPSKNMKKQKDVNPDFTEISKTFKDKTRKRNNQASELTATEDTYICDYGDVEFEDKGPMILYITSHKFAKDEVDEKFFCDNVMQSEITTIQGNNDENHENENNACSKNYGNSKKQKKGNPDINEKSKEFKDGLNNKIKYNLRMKIKLEKTDRGKQIENGETEYANDTDEDTNGVATKLINCKHCTYKTDNTSILKHILNHTQAISNQCESIYICKDCGREFKSKASLIIHIESHKNNSNQHLRIRRHLCVTCNSSFTTQANLINHQTKLHPSTKPYKCTMCDNQYITKQELTVHIETHKIKPFRCAICKYQCNKNNFVKHMKSHTDCKPFQCELCDFKFDKLSGLKQHMVTHSGRKEHKCTICDSKFSLLSGLNRHLLIHSKYKPFKCATCSAGFKDNSSLKRHKKIHTGEKTYKCIHCEYSCISGYDLKRHMNIHDTKLKQKGNATRNSGPFQCTLCDSNFTLKNSLICHMKIHTSEKIHKCTFCDKEFIHFSGLKRHLAVHSKNKPVKCTMCNTSYDNETALKWHLRRSKKHQ